ncbi:hypothetical protein KVT40_001503 [Elsinoe batatas]|uniref:Rhodopsin domain-containing protein n=1 Tax=Elsinoe batatas TaxID=2601811 RepID=A0A8K0L549_9PEZI|nr:hypothetical protein KVT40_001503 [Elsinoe batatas]
MSTPTTGAMPPAFTFPGSLYNGVSSYGGKGPGLLAVSWFFCALTLVVVGLRAYATVFVIRRPRIDLWIMLVALVLACISQGFTHRAVIYGIGQTMGRVAIMDAMQANLNVIISVCIGQLSLIIGKWGTALLILQIQGQTKPKLKWILYIALVVNTLIGLAASILMWLGCDRIKDQWQTNPVSNPTCKTFRVANNVSFTYWGISAFTDILLSVYPALIFLPLNMSLGRRIGLCVLFSGGVVAASFAILRIVKTLAIGEMSFIADYTGEGAETVRWAILEIWLVLLLTNIPPLRPLFAKAHTRLSSEDSLFNRFSKYVRKSTRSRSSAGSDPKGRSGPSDIEAQRPNGPPPTRQRLLTLGPMTKISLHMPSIFTSSGAGGTTRPSQSKRDTQAWSKFSFGFGNTQTDTTTTATVMSGHSRSHSDSTKIGSDDWGHEKERESFDGSPALASSNDSWLADNSDGDGESLVPPRSKFSLQKPPKAKVAPSEGLEVREMAHHPGAGMITVEQGRASREMAHHPGAGMIAVEREVNVNDFPRWSGSAQAGSRVEVQGSCPGEVNPRRW